MWVLIPVKPLAQAKTRLAGVLSPGERQALVRHMLDDVLAALAAAPGIAGIALVTADPAVARIGAEHGLRVLPESGSGLNAALHDAIATLAGEGVGTLLVLPADVPLFDAVTLEQLRAAHRAAPALTLVAASADGGTNALLLSPPDLLPPAFGTGSCAGYCRAAAELGLAPVLLELPQAALDIDRPEDLARLEFQTGATRTREFLHRIDAWARLRQGACESPVTLARHAS
ncbi:MAG: 2-phospho-L-lactate guanylyltransferase [Porticoccaceae bacterium]